MSATVRGEVFQALTDHDFLPLPFCGESILKAEDQLLWRRVISTIAVGELVHHKKVGKYQIGERKEMSWYSDVLDALAKIPGDMDIHEGDMWKNEITKGFFTKKMMNQMKKESHTTFGYLIGLAVLKSLFFGKATKKEENVMEGLAEMLGIIAKSTFSMK